jgi:acetyl esterase/lipase
MVAIPARRQISRKYWRGGALSLTGLVIVIATVVLVQNLSFKSPRTHASIPPQEKPALPLPDMGSNIQIFKRRMGDPDKPSDRDMLRSVSPLFSADRIRIPLLIAQGANDPIVTQLESEQIVAAIEKNEGVVTYVLYPDEGHGFVRPANIIDFVARTEKFLAEHLGGRYEPMTAERVAGSTAVVRVVGRQ